MFDFFSRLFKGRRILLVIICGPTASGKTGLSIEIAQELESQGRKVEIISADSRQVYTGIPIFSGAVTEGEMQGIKHHLVGEYDPATTLSVSWFKTKAHKIIDNAYTHKNPTLVVGGSAFWIQSLLFEDEYPHVEPNDVLRKELEQLSVEELVQQLRILDPKRLNAIDQDNPRRLIRAIEIATELGDVPQMKYRPQKQYDIMLVYVNPGREASNEKIARNVNNRIEQGLVEEARVLRKQVSSSRMMELGLGYKHIDRLWNEEITIDEFARLTTQEEQRYAKKQRTFFKKLTQQYKGVILQVSDPREKNIVDEIVSWLETGI